MKRILQRLSTSSSGWMTFPEDDSAVFTCFQSAQSAQNPSFTPSWCCHLLGVIESKIGKGKVRII